MTRRGSLPILLAMVAGPLAATIDTGPAPVVEATVYLSGAEVVREIGVAVPRGAVEVEVPVPLQVDEATLKVAAEGVPAVIGSVSVLPTEAEADEDVEAARQRVDELGDELYALERAATDDEALRRYLIGAGAASSSCGASRCRLPSATGPSRS